MDYGQDSASVCHRNCSSSVTFAWRCEESECYF